MGKLTFAIFVQIFFVLVQLSKMQIVLGFDPNFMSLQNIAENFAQEQQQQMLLFEQNFVPSYLKQLIDPSAVEKLKAALMGNKGHLFGPQTNQLCVDHWTQFISEIQGFKNKTPETWAIQMIDAWGKFGSGILSGHTSAVGDFLECLQIRGTFVKEDGGGRNVEDKESTFRGRYCSTYITPNVTTLTNLDDEAKIFENRQQNNLRETVCPGELVNLTLNPYGVQLWPFVGTCFPSSCGAEDVQIFFANFYNLVTNGTLGQSVVSCYTDEKAGFDTGAIVMIVVLSTIAILCIGGAAVDVLIYRKAQPDSAIRKGLPIQILVAFSLYTNTKKWLSPPQPPSSTGGKDNLGCLHGLRFLSMAWVVLGHTWGMLQFQFTSNLVDVKKMYNANLSMSVILNGWVAVDTFFAISGTLAAYNMLKELQKTDGKLNVPLMYLHRYLRLTPTYLILVGILATLLSHLGSGPMWYMIENEEKMCRKNWWHNALYVNNLIKYDGQDSNLCYGESWYLANDMQFFILSPFIIYPLWRWKKIGLALLALLSIGSIAAPAIITGIKGFPPTPIMFRNLGTIFQDIYMKPWARIGPYLVGIFLGYILTQSSSSSSRRLSKWIVLLGWLVSTATALAIVFGLKPYFDPVYDTTSRTMTPAMEAAGIAYAGLYRFVWGIVVCWIIFVCVNGHGGWVNDFLSWQPFVPLGRLTFCVYICSYYLQLVFHASGLDPIHYSPYVYVNLFFAHLVLSLLVGFVLTITLESPFIQLEKLIFQNRGSKKAAKKLAPPPAEPSKTTQNDNPGTVTIEIQQSSSS